LASRGDLGNEEGIKGATEDITRCARDGGVHYLFQSQGCPLSLCLVRLADDYSVGGPSAGFLPLTAQSMTIGFNVQVLSHFLVLYLLLTAQNLSCEKERRSVTSGALVRGIDRSIWKTSDASSCSRQGN
jgi:hypothetical protein